MRKVGQKAINGPEFNLINPWTGAWPTAAQGVIPSYWQCPSDNGAVTSSYRGTEVPLSNYLGIFSGYNDGENASLSNLTAHAAFRMGKGRAISSITDGTSNTIAVAEYLRGIQGTNLRGYIYTNRAAAQFLYMTVTPNSPAPDNLLNNADFCGAGSGGNVPHLNRPCIAGPTDSNFAVARSMHPGGVNVVLCDGSVRFVSNEISLSTWRALGSIQNGEVVGNY